MRTDSLDYRLPEDRIAAHPAEPRDAARLLVVNRADGALEHRHVRDLPDMPLGPGPGDLLIFNRTRVLPASLSGVRADTGGRVEGLYLRSSEDGAWELLLESRGRLRAGERITLPEPGAALILRDSLGRGAWRAEVHHEAETGTSGKMSGHKSGAPLGAGEALALLHRIGRTPLPPYIRRMRRLAGEGEVQPGDADRYNTVFGDEPGSVAAPTASLHFTPGLLAAIDATGARRATVTLHVGVGTFRPIEADDLADHRMHAEHVHVPAATRHAIASTQRAGGRVIPVGTTAVRAIESLPPDADADADPGHAPSDFTTDTELFIHPGPAGEPWPYRFTDVLMTNFHLPRSSLIAMVGALPGLGVDRLLEVYREAIARGYRFYSYGDAMWIA